MSMDEDSIMCLASWTRSINCVFFAFFEMAEHDDVGQRLDDSYGTRGAFVELCAHAKKCVSELGGLNGSGIFFLVSNCRVFHLAYRVGMDEHVLAQTLQKARTTEGFQGHGVIVGAFVDGKDSVMLQFNTVDRGRISIKWDALTQEEDVDTSAFDWSPNLST